MWIHCKLSAIWTLFKLFNRLHCNTTRDKHVSIIHAEGKVIYTLLHCPPPVSYVFQAIASRITPSLVYLSLVL
jgi:hypothetical protein